jgi:hypothetical protein
VATYIFSRLRTLKSTKRDQWVTTRELLKGQIKRAFASCCLLYRGNKELGWMKPDGRQAV